MPITISEISTLEDLNAFEFRITQKIERLESLIQSIGDSVNQSVGKKEFLSPKEFAARVGVSGNTVNRWCNEGTLRALQKGYKCSWMIPYSELERFREEALSLEPKIQPTVRVVA